MESNLSSLIIPLSIFLTGVKKLRGGTLSITLLSSPEPESFGLSVLFTFEAISSLLCLLELLISFSNSILLISVVTSSIS